MYNCSQLEMRRSRWSRANRRAKLRLVKKRNHVLPVMGAHLHLDHALPYTTLLWVANCSVLNFVLVSINSPYHGGGVVVRSTALSSPTSNGTMSCHSPHGLGATVRRLQCRCS